VEEEAEVEEEESCDVGNDMDGHDACDGSDGVMVVVTAVMGSWCL